jgi:hypothetical protein
MNLNDLKSKGIVASNQFVPRDITWDYFDDEGNEATLSDRIFIRRRSVADLDRIIADKNIDGIVAQAKFISENARLGVSGEEEIDYDSAKDFPVSLVEIIYKEFSIVNRLERHEPKN